MKQVTIFGAWWGGNLGDTAIVKSVVKNLNREYDIRKIVIPSKQPELLKKYLGKIKNVEIMRTVNHYFGIETIQQIRSSDLVIIGGGGLFFSHKLYNPFYNHVLNLWPISHICNLFNTPVHVLSIGATHIKTELSKYFIKEVVRNSNTVSARDKRSRLNIEEVCEEPVSLVPDPAFTIKPNPSPRIRKASDRLPNDFILLSLHHEVGKYSTTPSKTIANKITRDVFEYASEQGESVMLYNNYVNDNWFINLAEGVHNDFEDVETFTLPVDHVQPEEIVWLLSSSQFAVASQMHMNIFCIVAGLPSIAINYDNKVKSMMELFDNGNQVVPIDTALYSDDWLDSNLNITQKIPHEILDEKKSQFQRHIRKIGVKK